MSLTEAILRDVRRDLARDLEYAEVALCYARDYLAYIEQDKTASLTEIQEARRDVEAKVVQVHRIKDRIHIADPNRGRTLLVRYRKEATL